jgi:hypothetical protein
MGYAPLPLFCDSGLSIQNSEIESINGDGGHPALVDPTMVPLAARPLLRCPLNIPPDRGSLSIRTGGAESVMRGGQLSPRRMDVIRRRFEGEGFSSDVVDLFMAATRDNTTLRPGEFGQVGVWEGVPIPCLVM